MTQYYETPHGRRLAYRHFEGRTGVTFVWLSGFKSDMSGTKVTLLEDWAKNVGESFLAFDYSGHGLSDGRFEDGTISEWRDDVIDIISGLTDGPLVLVGSSMGGWMALLAANELKNRVRALVLIAPAPDFTQKLIWAGMKPDAREEVEREGRTLFPSDYGDPYPISKALIDDGESWSVLDEPITFDGPVRILQGMNDEDVPWQHAFRLIKAITSEDVIFQLIKDGDHRLSRDEDIARLIKFCSEL
ncbi:MAG: alpha/beta hydrolase [Pseudomonadota bacterium]